MNALLGAGGSIVSQLFFEHLRKRLDVPQRGAQIMGDGVSEGLQFLVDGGQLGVALRKPHIQFQDFPVRLFALGDIANGAGNQNAFLGFQGAEADLPREFAAFFVEAKQVQSGAHGAGAGLGEEAATMGRMAPAKTLGNEHLNLLS